MQITDFVPLILLGPFALLCLIGLIQEVKYGNTNRMHCKKHSKNIFRDVKLYNENKDIV